MDFLRDNSGDDDIAEPDWYFVVAERGEKLNKGVLG